MDSDSDTPVDDVRHGYDELAARADDDLDREGSPWGDSYFQQHYSWPATRAVLPPLDGRRVLLAGCGRGDYAPWYSERGARVTGADLSGTAIERARERFGDQATFYRADLTEPLAFAEDDEFDLVVSNLVMSHVEQWTPVFEEFARVLAPDRHLVVATIHPGYVRASADVSRYDRVEMVLNDWPGVEIPTYYRPISDVVTAFLDAGFRIDAFEEPTPRPEFENHHPQRYQEAFQQPELVVVRARLD